MKNLNSIALLAAAASLIVSTGCEKVMDINDSPNQAEKAPVGNIMTAAFVSHITAFEGEDARLAGMWSRQFSGADRQYLSYAQYSVNAEAFAWDKHYFGTCEQAEQAILIAEESNNQFYIGVAKLLQAHSYGTVAALYGDAPFSEANQFPEIADPVFDAQADIYAGVQDLLDEAIENLSSGIGADDAGVDFFFGGDPNGWIAAAHTLKARFYLHTGDYAAAAAAAEARNALGAADWMAPHSGGYNQGMNLYHSFGQWDRYGYMGAEDSYLRAILDTANADYRGNAKTHEGARHDDYFAFDPGLGWWDLNFYGGSLFSETSSFTLAGSAENNLILAEAMSRTGDDAGALTALNAVRQANQSKYPTGWYADYVETDFSTDSIADHGAGSVSANLLYEILEEKYVSLCGQIEVFNDLRRTDNLLGIEPTTGSAFPERFLYPQVELNANSNAPSTVDLFEATEVNQ